MRSQLALIAALLVFAAACTLLTGWSGAVVPRAEPVRELHIVDEKEIYALALAPDGKRLAVHVESEAGDLIRIYDLTTGRALGECPNPTDRWQFATFSHDGRQLALLEAPGRFGGAPPFHSYLFQVSPAGKIGGQRVLEPDLPSIPGWHYPYRVSFSPDGQTLAAATQEEVIYLWDVASGQIKRRFQGGVAVQFAPDGKTLIAVTHDGLLRRFDAATWQLLGPASPPRDDYFCVSEVAFSGDGRRVAVSDYWNVLVKEVASGKTLCRIDLERQNWLRFFAPDGKTLAVLLKDDGVRFFDTDTGKERGGVAGWPRVCVAGKCVENTDDHTIVVRDVASVLAAARQPAPRKAAAALPLAATLASRRGSYTLDLEGNTSDDFSTRIQFGERPDVPDLDLVVVVRNTGNEKIAFDPSGDCAYLRLTGPGAINFSWPLQQTGVGNWDRPAPVELGPGEARRISVTRDVGGPFPFWLLPGDYRLGGTFHASIQPAPPSSDHVSQEGFGWTDLRLEPIAVKVVADPKFPTGLVVDGAQFVNRPSAPGTLLMARPADDGSEDTRFKLYTQVTIGEFEASTKLGAALEYLRQRYSLELHVDEAAFARAGQKDLLESKVDFKAPPNMQLHTILECLADPFDGTTAVRGREVWLVPQSKRQDLAERLWANDFLTRQRQRVRERHVTLPEGIAAGTSLEAALRQVGEAAGITIWLDRRAFERRGGKKTPARPVRLGPQKTTPLPVVLEELVGQVDGRYLLREWIVVVGPRPAEQVRPE